MHIFIILGIDYLYLREYIMQLACYVKGKTSSDYLGFLDQCRGGSSFDQLVFLRD